MTPQETELQLAELRDAIEGWRRSHIPTLGMPKELWADAARLAKRLGLGVVVKALKIDHSKLRTLTEAVPAGKKLARAPRSDLSRTSSVAFVEFPTATAASFSPVSLSCLLEVESPSKSRLRAQLDNATALDVAAILREFAG